MKHSTFLLLTLFCLFVLTACDKKQRAIDNLSDFVEKVRKNAPDYTDKDWEEVDKEYDEIMTEIEKYEYSEKEAERIGELQGRLDAIKVKNGGKDVINTLMKWKMRIKSFFDEVLSKSKSPSEMPSLANEIDSIGSTGLNVATDLKGAVEGITEGITDGKESQEEKK